MNTYYVELKNGETDKLEALSKENVLAIYPDATAIYKQLELELELDD